MAIEVIMPKLGLTMTAGTVNQWLKKEREAVQKSEGLVQISTEKIVYTVESPADGILLKIVAPEGSQVPVGGLLGYVGTAEEAGEEAPAPAAAGSAAPEEEKPRAAPPAEAKPEPAPEPEFELVPYSGMRRAVGDNMIRSWLAAPKVTHQVTVDVSRALELLRRLNERLPEGEPRVSVTALLVKLVALALERHPRVNASLEGEVIKVFKQINVGVAVAVPDGLVVPVVREANRKSIFQISREVRDLSQRAREGRLTLDEMKGGTFTVTNLGPYGSVDHFTPIINPPESAILGVGRTVEMPVVVEGQIVIRPMMGLSLAFDHRVIDGAPAAEFLAELIRLLTEATEETVL